MVRRLMAGQAWHGEAGQGLHFSTSGEQPEAATVAGDWIPMRVDLAEDPAVIAVAAHLEIDEAGVVGRLHRLWVWANQQLSNGDAPSVTKKWIDRHTSTPGLADALVSVGWLVVTEAGVSIPKFDRWNSKGAKRRILTAQRMRKSRDADSDAGSVTKASPEKRREEIKESPSEIPAADTKPPLKSPTERKPRKRDPLFDAVAEVTGADPVVTGSHIGKVTALLRKAEPPYTPEEVRDFGARFAQLCPWSEGRRPTIGEVEKNIGLVRAGQGQPQRPPPRGFETPAQRMMSNLIDAMEDDGHE